MTLAEISSELSEFRNYPMDANIIHTLGQLLAAFGPLLFVQTLGFVSVLIGVFSVSAINMIFANQVTLTPNLGFGILSGGVFSALTNQYEKSVISDSISSGGSINRYVMKFAFFKFETITSRFHGFFFDFCNFAFFRLFDLFESLCQFHGFFFDCDIRICDYFDPQIFRFTAPISRIFFFFSIFRLYPFRIC